MHRKPIILLLLITALFSLPSSAAIGIGAHWGLDFSISMADQPREQCSFDSLRIPIDTSLTITGWGPRPAGFSQSYISGNLLPLYTSRTDMKRLLGNFGGKFFIDCLPLIDAIEVSGNFGVWEYDGKMIYPDSIRFSGKPYTDPNTNPDSLFTINDYDTFDIHVSKLKELTYLGVKETPYARAQVDLTIRKKIYSPPVWKNAIKLYGGAGASVRYATALLSPALVQKALLKSTDLRSVDSLQNIFGDPSAMHDVALEIMQSFTKPQWGMHIDGSIVLKFPKNLLGAYIDGKLMLPFREEQVDIKSLGFMMNIGLSFGL